MDDLGIGSVQGLAAVEDDLVAGRMALGDLDPLDGVEYALDPAWRHHHVSLDVADIGVP